MVERFSRRLASTVVPLSQSYSNRAAKRPRSNRCRHAAANVSPNGRGTRSPNTYSQRCRMRQGLCVESDAADARQAATQRDRRERSLTAIRRALTASPASQSATKSPDCLAAGFSRSVPIWQVMAAACAAPGSPSSPTGAMASHARARIQCTHGRETLDFRSCGCGDLPADRSLSWALRGGLRRIGQEEHDPDRSVFPWCNARIPASVVHPRVCTDGRV